MADDILASAFARFDKDGNGKLNATELIGILTRTGGGQPLSRADAQAIIEDFDTDADGMLDLKEFVKAFTGEVGVMGLMHVHADAGRTYKERDSKDVDGATPVGTQPIGAGAGAKHRSFSSLATAGEFRRYEAGTGVMRAGGEGDELRPYVRRTPEAAATSIQAIQRGRTVRERRRQP